MCGRYVSVASRVDVQELFGAAGPGDGTKLVRSYNVAPTNKVYAVVEPHRIRSRTGQHRCHRARPATG
jgi:putative SOS response-associated peptidase YedK